MVEKRKRSPNWLASEKNLLLDIVLQHFSIIENKRTDGVTIKQKAAEWNTMSDEYNFQTLNTHRTAENLKAQWESMKKAVKKKSSNIRMHLIERGGGSPIPKMEDPFYKRVLGLIEPSVVGLQNSFHEDAPDTEAENTVSEVKEMFDPMEPQEMAHVKVLHVEPPIRVSTPVSLAVKDPDWSNYTPFLLQTPVSKNLLLEERNCTPIKQGTTKRRPELTESSLELLHSKEVETIEIQKQHANDERREAKSLHDITMQIKQEELKIKKEELKQNKIKTRLLLLELRLKKKNAI